MSEQPKGAQALERAFIDGIASIATHNNVHRIVCYTLTADGAPVSCVELLIPVSGIKNFAEAIAALSP
jgi:hypothetical protein